MNERALHQDPGQRKEGQEKGTSQLRGDATQLAESASASADYVNDFRTPQRQLKPNHNPNNQKFGRMAFKQHRPPQP